MQPPASRVPARCWAAIRVALGIREASGIESISHSADALQVSGLARLRFHFPPQVQYVIVHGALGNEDSVTPRLTDQLVPAEHLALALDEYRQELELERRDLDRLAGTP